MGTRRERILQKLNPNLLKITPKLSGDTGSVIDLDSEDSLEDGAKKLMMRFFRNQDLCEKNKRNSGQQETELTISTAKYNDNAELCEIVSHNVILPFGREDDGSERRGKRLQDLKMELQEKMSAKWLEEYNKRVSENKSLTEPKGSCKEKHSKGEDSDGEDDEIEEEFDEANDADIEYEEDEDEVDKQNEDEDEDEVENGNEENGKDEDPDACSIGGDEQVPEDESKDKAENIQEKDNEYYDEEGCSWVPPYQPGGGMLYGGSELTQSDEGLPQSLLSPSLRFTLSDSCKASQDNVEQTPKKSDSAPSEELFTSFREKVKLFSQNTSDSYDLNDAFELCSGKFPEPGEENEVNNEDEEEKEEEEEEEEEEEGCDDQFESAIEEDSDEDSQTEEVELEKKPTRKNIITFDDSEGEEDEKVTEDGAKAVDDEEEPTSQLGHSKLLSDDEDDDHNNDDPNSENKTEPKKKKKARKNLQFSDEEDEEEEADDEEVEANDDCEEENEGGNEDDERRSIQYDSEENEIINPKEFFEKEAELSGSEFSGDEDERGLDEFDLEEGDADNLDEDQVRSQLERIHVRRVMDDDAREVRLLQEILFEDGDLYTDGKVRERKFKWKNLGDFGDEKETEGGPKDGDGNSSEEEGAEEEEMRKLRHEKELFLMEKTARKNDEDLSSDEEIVENFHTIKVTSVKTSIKQSEDRKKTENPKLVTDYIEMAKTGKLSTVRGSFLSRNEEFLSRLAKATSGVSDSLLGPKNSKNFVFAPKSPEKVELEKSTACKRQVEESSCSGREKKLKLLPREIDTGPSILDLLV